MGLGVGLRVGRLVGFRVILVVGLRVGLCVKWFKGALVGLRVGGLRAAVALGVGWRVGL